MDFSSIIAWIDRRWLTCTRAFWCGLALAFFPLIPLIASFLFLTLSLSTIVLRRQPFLAYSPVMLMAGAFLACSLMGTAVGHAADEALTIRGEVSFGFTASGQTSVWPENGGEPLVFPNMTDSAQQIMNTCANRDVCEVTYTVDANGNNEVVSVIKIREPAP
ncbi:MAG: hypothetical protein LBV79_04240 [Candidatus Adiutrix sp.]|nr:hypothetical protein [Candidatus Adiutrix sp.]